MTSLSVVIPAYNEADGIAEISNRVLAVQPDLEKIGVGKLELLVVDDGSKDDTAKIATAINGVTLIKHPINRGYGAALKTGFSKASGDLIGFLDADGTYPPEYFPELCVPAMDGVDLVVGSRMAGKDSQMPITRRAGNLFFAGLLSFLGRRRISDSASGMRVFKRDVLKKLYPLPDGLNLTPVMSTRALHEGISMEEVPIPYSERLGRSKLNVFRDGSLFLRSIIWTALTYNPVRIFGFFGLICIAIALLIGLGLVITRIRGVTMLSGQGVVLLYGAMVAAVTGVSVFALGITFNYLVSLFYKRPIRQGLFGRPILKNPLDNHFGWIGLITMTVGFGIAFVSISLGINGWDIVRLWLYLLGSAMAILIGVQLCTFWMIFRVLEEVIQREVQFEVET